MLRLLLAALILMTLIVAGCPRGDDADDAEPGVEPEVDADATAVDRGRAIFVGTDYSATGLTCAHCHAIMPQDEQNRIFIAHNAYGAAQRGAWWIKTQEQLDAKKGEAETLVDAANVCVAADYLAHGDELIDGEDAEALLAFYESIAQADEPFLIAKASGLPAPGLTPDKVNGKRIYDQSCSHCHAAGIEGLPELAGLAEWMEVNPVQIMAKIRGLDGDWYDDFAGMDYAKMDAAAGSPEDKVVTPDGAEDAEEGEAGHAEHDEDEHGVFEEGAMPFYTTDILSDQYVVDVAYYIVEDLKAAPEVTPPANGEPDAAAGDDNETDDTAEPETPEGGE